MAVSRWLSIGLTLVGCSAPPARAPRPAPAPPPAAPTAAPPAPRATPSTLVLPLPPAECPREIPAAQEDPPPLYLGPSYGPHGSVTAIALERDALYWMTQTSNTTSYLSRMPRAGGEARVLWRGPPNDHITVADSAVLLLPFELVDGWTWGIRELLLLEGGRPPEMLSQHYPIAHGCMFNYVVADRRDIFFTRCVLDGPPGFQIVRRSRRAGSEAVAISSNWTTFTGLALARDHLIFNQSTGGPGDAMLLRIPRSGGDVEGLEVHVRSFDVSGDSLFFVTTDGAVFRRSASGDERRQIGAVPAEAVPWIGGVSAGSESAVYLALTIDDHSDIVRIDDEGQTLMASVPGDFPVFDAHGDVVAVANGDYIDLVESR